jgi:hypothetical protein
MRVDRETDVAHRSLVDKFGLLTSENQSLKVNYVLYRSQYCASLVTHNLGHNQTIAVTQLHVTALLCSLLFQYFGMYLITFSNE